MRAVRRAQTTRTSESEAAEAKTAEEAASLRQVRSSALRAPAESAPESALRFRFGRFRFRSHFAPSRREFSVSLSLFHFSFRGSRRLPDESLGSPGGGGGGRSRAKLRSRRALCRCGASTTAGSARRALGGPRRSGSRCEGRLCLRWDRIVEDLERRGEANASEVSEPGRPGHRGIFAVSHAPLRHRHDRHVERWKIAEKYWRSSQNMSGRTAGPS